MFEGSSAITRRGRLRGIQQGVACPSCDERVTRPVPRRTIRSRGHSTKALVDDCQLFFKVRGVVLGLFHPEEEQAQVSSRAQETVQCY